MNRLLLLLCLLVSLPAMAAKPRKVKVTTPYGNMVIILYNETPRHRDNFIRLAKHHFYDSTLFHRVIKGFMIQGGDPDSKHAAAGAMLGNGDVNYTIPAEFQLNLYHKKGALAAARDDNPAKASSGCQFYIVQGKLWTDEELDKLERGRLGGRKIPLDIREYYKKYGGTPQLDQSYTVFGQVVEGLDVIDKIAALKTDRNDRPLDDVPMKIRVVKRLFFF